MARGTYQVPRPLEDQDKWFRFFTKKQLAYVGAALLLDVFIYTLFAKMHLSFIGICLCVGNLLIAGVLGYISIPTDKYLMGGGERAEVIVFRIINRKFNKKNHIIYVKNYDPDYTTVLPKDLDLDANGGKKA